MQYSHLDLFKRVGEITDLPGSSKAILWQIVWHWNSQTGRIFPSKETLARLTGHSRSTVTRAILDLNKRGYIGRVRAVGGVNNYRLNLFDPAHSEPTPAHSEPTPPAHNEPVTREPLEQEKEQKNMSNSLQLSMGSELMTSHLRYDEAFEAFWEIYPKRQGKGKAFEAFKKALKKVDFQSLLQIVSEYAKSVKSINLPRKYIPMASTWLNQERWEDDIEVPEANPHNWRTEESGADRAARRAKNFAEKYGNGSTRQLDSGQDRNAPIPLLRSGRSS